MYNKEEGSIVSWRSNSGTKREKLNYERFIEIKKVIIQFDFDEDSVILILGGNDVAIIL